MKKLKPDRHLAKLLNRVADALDPATPLTRIVSNHEKRELLDRVREYAAALEPAEPA